MEAIENEFAGITFISQINKFAAYSVPSRFDSRGRAKGIRLVGTFDTLAQAIDARLADAKKPRYEIPEEPPQWFDYERHFGYSYHHRETR